MREPNLPSVSARRSLAAALAVVIVALLATVIIAVEAGWRAVMVLPPVIAAVTMLAKEVVRRD